VVGAAVVGAAVVGGAVVGAAVVGGAVVGGDVVVTGCWARPTVIVIGVPGGTWPPALRLCAVTRPSSGLPGATLL
jgi:hypothetical protein